MKSKIREYQLFGDLVNKINDKTDVISFAGEVVDGEPNDYIVEDGATSINVTFESENTGNVFLDYNNVRKEVKYYNNDGILDSLPIGFIRAKIVYTVMFDATNDCYVVNVGGDISNLAITSDLSEVNGKDEYSITLSNGATTTQNMTPIIADTPTFLGVATNYTNATLNKYGIVRLPTGADGEYNAADIQYICDTIGIRNCEIKHNFNGKGLLRKGYYEGTTFKYDEYTNSHNGVYTSLENLGYVALDFTVMDYPEILGKIIGETVDKFGFSTSWRIFTTIYDGNTNPQNYKEIVDAFRNYIGGLAEWGTPPIGFYDFEIIGNYVNGATQATYETQVILTHKTTGKKYSMMFTADNGVNIIKAIMNEKGEYGDLWVDDPKVAVSRTNNHRHGLLLTRKMETYLTEGQVVTIDFNSHGLGNGEFLIEEVELIFSDYNFDDALVYAAQFHNIIIKGYSLVYDEVPNSSDFEAYETLGGQYDFTTFVSSSGGIQPTDFMHIVAKAANVAFDYNTDVLTITGRTVTGGGQQDVILNAINVYGRYR